MWKGRAEAGLLLHFRLERKLRGERGGGGASIHTIKHVKHPNSAGCLQHTNLLARYSSQFQPDSSRWRLKEGRRDRCTGSIGSNSSLSNRLCLPAFLLDWLRATTSWRVSASLAAGELDTCTLGWETATAALAVTPTPAEPAQEIQSFATSPVTKR